jgi:hypothetical protein
MFKSEAQAHLKPDQVVTARMNIYENARNQLRQRFGREPLPQEIDAAIEELHSGGK